MLPVTCFTSSKSKSVEEPKLATSCFWAKPACNKNAMQASTDIQKQAEALARSWKIPQSTAQLWFRGDASVREAVEEQFRQTSLKQIRSYASSASDTSQSDEESSRQNSRQNSIHDTTMDTVDLSPTKRTEWEQQQSDDTMAAIYQRELKDDVLSSADHLSDDQDLSTTGSWLQKDLYINPHEIFFCSRSNGKLLRIGKGSYGSVYKGVWSGEMVAVKVCNQQKVTKKAKLQFQQEVSILHSCHHPNVVQFKGACCWKGGKRTVLVTEYMEKGDLCSAISRATAKCSWNRLGKSLALDIARGLEFLHTKNIVHFDLKSGNILLDRHNTAKLADVGLAKILTKTHNDSLATFLATTDLGTFAWAAPEALLGFACDAKADIFSFGIVLWEICTGEVPQGRNLRPIQIPEEAPQVVADLVSRCLEYQATARPSATQIIQILESLQ